jgi:hypothetical protein
MALNGLPVPARMQQFERPCGCGEAVGSGRAHVYADCRAARHVWDAVAAQLQDARRPAILRLQLPCGARPLVELLFPTMRFVRLPPATRMGPPHATPSPPPWQPPLATPPRWRCCAARTSRWPKRWRLGRRAAAGARLQNVAQAREKGRGAGGEHRARGRAAPNVVRRAGCRLLTAGRLLVVRARAAGLVSLRHGACSGGRRRGRRQRGAWRAGAFEFCSW